MNAKSIRPEVIRQDDGRLIVVDPQSVAVMGDNVRQLGQYILQMGQMIASMQKRMDALEARQEKVTVTHNDVLQLMARIRWRAGETVKKYGLEDPESLKAFRAAIKKDIQKRFQVRDLHDLPAAMLPAVEKQVDGWADIRLVMERRARQG